MYTGTPDSGIKAIDVADGEVKSTLKESSFYVSQSADLVAKDGYDVYYTTDDSDPTTASTKYTTPLSISKSTVVKAIAVKNGSAGSVYTFNYKIIPYEVKGDHAPGTYTDSVVVEFRSKNSNDKIYYTTDGSDPTTQYIKPMLLKESTTFKVKSYSPVGEAGNIGELVYVINKSGNISAPKVSVPEGTYGKDFSVAITSDTVIKAIAVAGGKSSQVTTEQYKFNRVNTPFLKADGKAYKTNYGLGDTVILRGTNAGGWLLPENWQCPTNAADLLTEKRVLTERFGAAEAERLIRLYEDSWWTEDDFDKIKAEGMNMIRLPISYFEMLNDDGSLRNDAFERLDWFVSECAKRGIYVQIDMHGAVGSQNGKDHSGDTTIADVGNFYGNEQNIQKTIKLWEKIAERFKENPWVCGYDLLNEPSAVGKVQFETYDRLYKAIRTIDKDHIIFMQAIWEPQHLPNPSYYNWRNIAYEYHFYGWDVEKDAEGQKAFIQSKIKFVNEYTNYGVPVLVGEFSFFSNTQSWFNGLDLLESQGWSYTNWTYKVTGEGSSWRVYTAKNKPVDINNDSIATITVKNVGGNTAVCTVTVNRDGSTNNSGGNSSNGGSSSSRNSSTTPVTDNKPNTTESKNEGWNKLENNWVYMKDGKVVTGWLQDENKNWYFMNNSGVMQTGWVKDSQAKWYYLDNSGAMKTGWVKDTDGKWYYLYESGSLASSTVIDGYVVGRDGAWTI